MWRFGSCCRRSGLFYVLAAPIHVATPSRWCSQKNSTPVAECAEQAGRADGIVAAVSQQEPFGEDMFPAGFDELEAASQEIHDLCYAMINYLRKVDPDETKSLFEKRCARHFRDPVPENKRRLLHGHNSRSLYRRNCYRTKKEYQEATGLFLQFGEKLLLLLTKPVMQRIIDSAGKGCRDHRNDGVHKYRNVLERGTWRGFPHRWFKHAPFEVQQLRADIPEATVANTRAMRDRSTINSLFTLMEPQHPFRSRLEDHLFEITKEYDPVHKTERNP
uniref:Uncharacterized protein n=1 Tax=Trypanosoma congolense (strain IL3000) TaxID=1068625 RepID=G0UKL4_TRYCI|nr:conserved hypothetical protein [Trypanosoma congolense IL3000]